MRMALDWVGERYSGGKLEDGVAEGVVEVHLLDLYFAGKEPLLVFSEELRSVEGDAGVEAGVPGVEVVLALDAEEEHD